MEKAEVNIVYYKGNGFPLRRAWRECWDPQKGSYDPHKYLHLLNEIGFERKTVSHDGLTNPSKPIDVTPMQDLAPVANSQQHRRLHTVVFELGRAVLHTNRVLSNGHFVPMERQEIYEDLGESVQIKNVRVTKDEQGRPEEYVLAELSYQERHGRGIGEDLPPQPIPTPSPSPKVDLVA